MRSTQCIETVLCIFFSTEMLYWYWEKYKKTVCLEVVLPLCEVTYTFSCAKDIKTQRVESRSAFRSICASSNRRPNEFYTCCPVLYLWNGTLHGAGCYSRSDMLQFRWYWADWACPGSEPYTISPEPLMSFDAVGLLPLSVFFYSQPWGFVSSRHERRQLEESMTPDPWWSHHTGLF